MGLRCLFGHQWNGCKCSICGKIRDRGHDWNGCKCKVCGKVRDESHKFDLCSGKCNKCGKFCEVKHDWNGCRCGKCGKKRNEAHDWNGCKCQLCGKIREDGHDWNGCKCKICESTRNEHHNWNGLECSVCRKRRDIDSITEQAVFVDIVKNGKEDYDVRQLAVEKLTDLVLLEELAKEVVYLDDNALKKLPENALWRIAESNGYSAFQAAVMIGNQKLIWNNCSKGKDAIIRTVQEHITDQNILFDIVMNYQDVTEWAHDREAIFEKLTDQLLLAKIVKNHDNSMVREIAFLKLGSPTNLLADMAKKGDISAIEKLTDKALLTDIANNAKEYRTRIAAAEKLQDRTILVEIANNTNNNHYDRIHAVDVIADKAFAEKLFSKIIENDSDWHARRLAINFSTNKALLTKIANGGAKYIHKYESAGYDDNIGHTIYTLEVNLCEEAKQRLRCL